MARRSQAGGLAADANWQPRPHWVETDRIVTVDAGRPAVGHLASVVNSEKLFLLHDSIRMMLNL